MFRKKITFITGGMGCRRYCSCSLMLQKLMLPYSMFTKNTNRVKGESKIVEKIGEGVPET